MEEYNQWYRDVITAFQNLELHGDPLAFQRVLDRLTTNLRTKVLDSPLAMGVLPKYVQNVDWAGLLAEKLEKHGFVYMTSWGTYTEYRYIPEKAAK